MAMNIQEFLKLINTPQNSANATATTKTVTPQENLQALFNSPQYSLVYGTHPMDSTDQLDPMQRFFRSPAYGLLYGQQNSENQQQYWKEGNYDPTKAFHEDPGYQFAISEGMKQLQQNAAAKGLLESGPLQKELLKYAQGTADQNYQRWLGQQQQLLQGNQSVEAGLMGDRMNHLAQLAQFGAGQTGGAQAYDSGNILAQLLANTNMNYGNQQTGANLTTGTNLGSLFANQGVLNANAFLNTAAARANNIMQGNIFTSQIIANQLARQDQQMNSMFSGAGAQQGYSGGQGGMF